MTKRNNRDTQILNNLFSAKLGGNSPCDKLFLEDPQQIASVRQRNLFVRLCRDMVRQHQYSALLWYVHDVFCHRQEMNLDKLHEVLSQVSVRENYTLADLCQAYLLDIHEAGEGEPIPEPVDLYHNCPEDLELLKGLYPKLGQILPMTLLKRVYGVAAESLRPETIDALVSIVRQQTIAAHEADCQYVDETNLEYEQWGMPDRLVHPSFSDFQRDAAIPGLLMPFLMAAELRGETELCYYILETYVFPALELVPWEQEYHPDLPAITQTVHYYADYLQSLLYHDFFNLEDVSSAADARYLQKVFYYEALGKGNRSHYRYAGDQMEAYCGKHKTLYHQWANVLHRGGGLLKNAMRLRGYSFHMLNTAYMLFFSGQTEEACQFLLQHYGDLDDYEKRKPHIQILLVRCILNTTRLETANALYGLFSYEMDRPDRERESVRGLGIKMVQFLRDSQDYIRTANEHTIDENLSWYDILFGSGAIDALLDRCAQHLSSNRILPADLFKTLCICVDAFSYQSGIRLNLLGLRNYDGYDKLQNALSRELILKGQACLAQATGARVYYARLMQAEPLRNINLHLQNHLFKLQSGSIKENLQRVDALKQAVPQDMDEAQREHLLEEISQIAEDLMVTVQGAPMWRPEVEQHITALREDFELKYLQGDVDLMQKLPEDIRADVHNYLVTSNMVFRMMESQNDDSLDYSAALISMTKALELVMAHIYSRMDLKEYEGMDDDTRKYYFDKDGNPIKVQTLRPCIEILKGKKRFDAWGGHAVLDMDKLGLFADLPLQTGADSQGQPKLRQFKQGKKHLGANTETLQLALMYICNNYRNRSAHTAAVTITHVQECQQLLIDGQKLLWVVLAILK